MIITIKSLGKNDETGVVTIVATLPLIPDYIPYDVQPLDSDEKKQKKAEQREKALSMQCAELIEKKRLHLGLAELIQKDEEDEAFREDKEGGVVESFGEQ